MTKILQSIPHPTYTTVERDLLVDVLKNTLINNSDIGKVEEFDGSIWNSVGGNIVDQTAANTTVDASGFNGNLTPADFGYLDFANPILQIHTTQLIDC